MMMKHREHSPEGLVLHDPPPPVDIIVTTCGEPFGVIEQTLRAVAGIRYPEFQVTVADDRADPQVEGLCRKLGFSHLGRLSHENRKAGNLNHALTNTRHPFLMTLDADQICHPEILQRLMGYFAVSKIAFVQSYQNFDVSKGDPWANRDIVFYGSMQPSRNASSSAISCGSGVVYRREALNEVGGFSTWNVVEDLYTSLLLNAAGWRSVYHQYPLSHGTMPHDIAGQVRQRWQWALDSTRLFIWRCPLFTKGLSWRQRLNYFNFGYHYLVFGISYPIFFLLPSWGLFSGEFIIRAPAWEFILWRLPYFAAFLMFNRLITDGRHTVKEFRAQVGLFMVFFWAVATALFSRTRIPRYVVTRKGADEISLLDRLQHVLPHLFVMIMSLTGIAYGFFHRGEHTGFFVLNTAGALWIIWLLLPFTLLALRAPPAATDEPNLS
jgi:cellulose synthase (UDP-forming)